MTERSHSSQSCEPDATDSAQVLALVAINAPLPKATAAALRLTCQATKLAVDQTYKRLKISQNAFRDLRVEGNSLTTGLTAVRFYGTRMRACNSQSFINACTAARINAHSLEHLSLMTNYSDEDYDGVNIDALEAVGSCAWPNLLSLTLWSIPDTFNSITDIDTMPQLTELRLRGCVLSAQDIDALAAGQRFPSMLRVLDIRPHIIQYPKHDSCYNSMKQFLQMTSRLRQFTLGVFDCDDLDFFNGVQLPALEEFTLKDVPAGVSLAPVASVTMPRLRKLDISGGHGGNAVDAADLAPLFSWPFPALRILHLGFDCADMGYLREISAPSLESLCLHGWTATAANTSAIIVAMGRLPKHVTLKMFP